jgi:hypothetical protein
MVRQHDALHVMRERFLNVLRMAFKAATLMVLLMDEPRRIEHL